MLKINNIEYDVGVASVSRSLRVDEKYRVKTEDGVVHREIRAKYMDFMLSVGNFGKSAYDALLTVLLEADGDVTIEISKSASITEVYMGVFDMVTDEIASDDGTEVTWDNLTLAFTGTVPLEV